MKKILNTSTGSIFVKDSGQMYFLSFEEQNAKQLQEIPLEKGEEIPKDVIDAKVAKEKKEADLERDEVQRKAAERVGMGAFFNR